MDITIVNCKIGDMKFDDTKCTYDDNFLESVNEDIDILNKNYKGITRFVVQHDPKYHTYVLIGYRD